MIQEDTEWEGTAGQSEEKTVVLLREARALYVPVTCQVRLRKELPKKHPVCHIAENCSLRCAILKADTVANLVKGPLVTKSVLEFPEGNSDRGRRANTQTCDMRRVWTESQILQVLLTPESPESYLIPKLHTHLPGHSGSYTHGCHSPGLGAGNLHTLLCVTLNDKEERSFQ